MQKVKATEELATWKIHTHEKGEESQTKVATVSSILGGPLNTIHALIHL